MKRYTVDSHELGRFTCSLDDNGIMRVINADNPALVGEAIDDAHNGCDLAAMYQCSIAAD